MMGVFNNLVLYWKHLWTSNPIESTFATVGHRTFRAKGCLSNKTALAMCSSWSMPRRKAGVGSMATISCPSSFKVSGSPTESKSPPTRRPRKPKPPPPDPSGHHQDSAIARDQTVDGDHGRIETRTTTVIHDVAWLQERHDWPGLKVVVMVESTREIAGKIEQETRFYITSLVLLANLLGPIIRSHWAIEN